MAAQPSSLSFNVHDLTGPGKTFFTRAHEEVKLQLC